MLDFFEFFCESSSHHYGEQKNSKKSSRFTTISLRSRTQLLFLGLFFSPLSPAFTTQPPSTGKVVYPCAEECILTYFKRPTVASSACPVPYGQFTLEGGIQYNKFINQGEKWTAPQSKIRIGLPWRSEFAILFPSEKTNSQLNIAGLSPTQLALKHEITYSEHWNLAARVVYLPASGGKHYGIAHDGVTLDGILVYRRNNINVTAMLGVSSLSTSKDAGGTRYSAFSPDILVGWYAQSWLELYVEVYGQTRTAPERGAGYNLDTGLIFLITQYIALDMEIGKSLSGQLGSFNTYYGSGISFMF